MAQIPRYDRMRYYRLSDDQRRILKDKTGFEGYTAYLEDYNKKNSGYEDLLEAFLDLRETSRKACPSETLNSCDIIDLIKDESSSVSCNICCQTFSNSELFTALSEPQKGVYGRIVVWHLGNLGNGQYDFLEDLGLVLNIGPTFLNCLFATTSKLKIRFTDVPICCAYHHASVLLLIGLSLGVKHRVY